MPELPEVETVRLSIRPDIIGCQIEKIEILTPESGWVNIQT
jgi:formamidopyrimidine-DNA glycosylase